jgi:hypothetical protein
MPHQIACELAFGPSALNDLVRAFDSAWLELCAWSVEANTEEQIKRIRTNLAQRIMEDATEGERDVVHLKAFGLQGLPHLCAHRVRLPKAVTTSPPCPVPQGGTGDPTIQVAHRRRPCPSERHHRAGVSHNRRPNARTAQGQADSLHPITPGVA